MCCDKSERVRPLIRAIGVIEFMSIAKGIEATDRMLKVARVEILKSSTVCPGKYITILSGDVDDVDTAVALGQECGGEYVVDKLTIHNIHEQLVPAIVQANTIENSEAIGIMEFYSVTSGILAADIAAKAASISLIEVRIGYAIGGKGLVIITGGLEAVQTSINKAISSSDDSDLLMQVSVIPRPEPDLLETLL